MRLSPTPRRRLHTRLAASSRLLLSLLLASGVALVGACSSGSNSCTGGGFVCQPGFVCSANGACVLGGEMGLVGDGGAGCISDTSCAAPTPRCDVASQRCVPCLPTLDNCGLGKRCVAQNGSYACTATCATSADCASDGGDGANIACCGGACIATDEDVANCGKCGMVCPSPTNAAAICQLGVCGLGACNAGFGDCDGNTANGCETATTADPLHCGGCNVRCGANANASPTCAAGACANLCVAHFGDCDGDADNGCETGLLTNNSHCGSCGNVCPTSNNATLACAGGTCSKLTCKFGFGDCNNSPTDGCEASLLDVGSCGACGIVCPEVLHGAAGCNAGLCGVGMCDANYGDCDGNATNGCELPLATDVDNCGACGARCAPANGTGACLGGQCGIVQCNNGFHDCNADPRDGCESQLTNDPMNCGVCGKVCPTPPHMVALCTSSACSAICATGFADCNNNTTDGCEADLSSAATCGTCTNFCNALPHAQAGCSFGNCAVGTCDTGFADCNGVSSDGCEKSVVSDPDNCGACNVRCFAPSATSACLGGQCGISACTGTTADCDGSYANGCEANLQTDAANCGACGTACGAGLICRSGGCTCAMCNLPNASATCVNNACVFQSCTTGYGNCDNNPANGCEVDTRSDVKNCGACNNACPSNQYCIAGQCKTAPPCPNILFVVDDSGSMVTMNPGTTTTRLEQAIAEVTGVLNLYPNAAPYGLEIFTSSSTGFDTDATCYSDTSIAVAPAAGTAATIKSMIAPLQPAGGSNVGEAVERAATALTDTTRDNVMILITDGGPNCNSGDQNGATTFTVSQVVNAASANPSVKTAIVGFDDIETGVANGPPALYETMATDGNLARPGCTGAAPTICYYSAWDTTAVQQVVERLLLVQGGVPGCVAP